MLFYHAWHGDQRWRDNLIFAALVERDEINQRVIAYRISQDRNGQVGVKQQSLSLEILSTARISISKFSWNYFIQTICATFSQCAQGIDHFSFLYRLTFPLSQSRRAKYYCQTFRTRNGDIYSIY